MLTHELQRLILALHLVAVVIHDVVELPQRRAVDDDRRPAVAELDELFDEVRRLALHEDRLRVAARAEHARHAERVLRRHRRRQVVGELHVQRRERARHDPLVVVGVEAGRERASFAGRTDIHHRVAIGVADVRVRENCTALYLPEYCENVACSTVSPSPLTS